MNKIFIFLQVFFSFQCFAFEAKKINMFIGETKSLELLEVSYLKLNKKGIIEVYMGENSIWDIIALSPGVVIINAHFEDNAKPSKRFVVEVARRPQSNKAEVNVGENKNFNFILKTKIILMDKTNYNLFGLQFDKKNLDIGIQSLESSKLAKVIGEPVFRLNSGFESRIHSGREFQIVNESTRSRKTSWKKVGLEVRVKAQYLSDIKGRLEFYVSFSNKSEAFHSNEIQVCEIHSLVDLKLGEAVIVAGSEIESNNNGFDSAFSFKDIPILGPLFRLGVREHNNNKLFLWLELSKDDGKWSQEIGEDSSISSL